jgi:hypothetical protein
MRLITTVGSLSALVLAVLSACGGSGPGNTGFPVADASTTGDDSATSGTDSGLILPLGDSSLIGSGDSTAPQMGCSPDLHSVTNGNGVVVETCPADEGCAGGMCVPACQAAGASHGNIGCDFQVATPSPTTGERR